MIKGKLTDSLKSFFLFNGSFTAWLLKKNKTLAQLSKKLCAYSAAAGAAATAGVATDANAAPMIYDTEATPINVHSSFETMPGHNMAIIDPSIAGSDGLLAVDDIGIPPLPGPPLRDPNPGEVYFRYGMFSEPSATWGKSGTQFGTLTGGGNGLYAVSQGASTRPAGEGGVFGFKDGDIIGDGDPLITTDTVGADGILQAYSGGPGAGAVQADIDGFGGWATGSHYGIVSGPTYLGFRIDNKNGFVKMRPVFRSAKTTSRFMVGVWKPCRSNRLLSGSFPIPFRSPSLLRWPCWRSVVRGCWPCVDAVAAK